MENGEKDEKTMVSKEAHIKKVYSLHLFYICVICVIISITVICIIPNAVSDAAFQNFSFTSTIVSIVLAVVSIVYSLWSGKSSNSQYDSIRHIERQIDLQLDNFKEIDQSIHSTLEAQQQKLDRIHEDQNRNFISLIGNSTHDIKQTHDGFSIDSNPSAANVCLFTFSLSFDNKKELPKKILDKYLQKYWLGYLVALSRSLPEKIKYENANNHLKVTCFDATYFSSTKLEQWIEMNATEYSNMVGEIKSHYVTYV